METRRSTTIPIRVFGGGRALQLPPKRQRHAVRLERSAVALATFIAPKYPGWRTGACPRDVRAGGGLSLGQAVGPARKITTDSN
jgi:hypothetical protein